MKAHAGSVSSINQSAQSFNCLSRLIITKLLKTISRGHEYNLGC